MTVTIGYFTVTDMKKEKISETLPVLQDKVEQGCWKSEVG